MLNHRTIIINADDFGMTPGINQGIRLLHSHKRLTGVSIVTNMPWSSEALDFASHMEDLKYGTHLNLTTGQPLSSPDKVPTLVNANGEFCEISVFLSRYITGKLDFDEIERELAAQVERCLGSDVQLQHLDSHMHLHSLPACKKNWGSFWYSINSQPQSRRLCCTPFRQSKKSSGDDSKNW